MPRVTELNPRGEVEVELSDGSVYNLKYTTNRFAKLEQIMAQTVGMSVFEAMGKGSILSIKMALWAGIGSKHLTADEVGKKMEPKKLRYYTEKILEAFEAAGFLGEDDDEAEDAEVPDPGEDEDNQ